MTKRNSENAEQVDVETVEEAAEETAEGQAEASSDEQASSQDSSSDAEQQENDADDSAADDDSSSELLNLQNKIKELEKKADDSEDKFRRLYAEFENFKRRSKQESQTLLKFAQQPLAVSILPGLDNLDRALQHAREEDDGQNTEFIKGVEMVFNELHEALKKHNITLIEAEGKKFDPTLHEAVGVVQSDDVEPDHVVNVFQAGYMMHDRVIRPSMVQVAKK